MAPLLGFLGLLVQYGIDKFLLLRYFQRPTVIQNQYEANKAMDHVGTILLPGLPLFMVVFLGPSWESGLSGMTWPCRFALIPAALFFLFKMPLETCTAAMGSWVQCLIPNRGVGVGALLGAGGDDYYRVQHMWPPDWKYHKTHFLYEDLPEEINPEILEPETSDVDHHAFGDKWKAKKKRAQRPRALMAAPGSAAKQFDAVSPAVYGRSSAIWQFEVDSGFEPFDRSLHLQIDSDFWSYQSGDGPSQVEIQSGPVMVSLDFSRMTSIADGGSRVRRIRRRSPMDSE